MTASLASSCAYQVNKLRTKAQPCPALTLCVGVTPAALEHL